MTPRVAEEEGRTRMNIFYVIVVSFVVLAVVGYLGLV
jgi:hypothetical protein